MARDFEAHEFERLLREFSHGFSQPSSSEGVFDLSAPLGSIAAFVGFDTAALLCVSEREAGWETMGVWHTSRILDPANEMPGFECPWLIGEIMQGSMLCVLDLEGLPFSAPKDGAAYASYGIRSLYGLPLFGGSRVVGGLVLGAREPQRQITAESIGRAQILGEILANGLVHTSREARLTAAIEAASAGLWSLNLATMSLWATETARAIHGFTATETLNLDKLLDAVYADDRDMLRRTVEQAVASPESMSVEYRVALADSALRWIVARGCPYDSASGKARQLMGVCADITERKQTEEDLRDARALTDAVFDSVPGLLYLYSEDGRLIRWNKQHEKLTGYTAEELLNFPAADWFTENDLAIMRREWGRVFSEGRATTELGVRLKDGTVAPFALTGVRVEIDGKPHLVGIGMDITENRRVEASLAQLRAELAHTTRVTTLGELGSALAHELNQPLAAILSNAQAARRLLLMQLPDLDEVRAALEDIIADDRRAGEIVHGLRSLMTKGKVKHDRLDMNKLVRVVAALIHGELMLSGVRLELDLQPDLPTIEAGQTEVQQVLLNLMLNGIDAQRTTALVSRRLTVTTKGDADSVVVAVRDRGTGISKDRLQHVFEPFFSTKSGGLGMGLAICRRIAETYQGRVWGENNADGGASFYLALPIAETEA